MKINPISVSMWLLIFVVLFIILGGKWMLSSLARQFIYPAPYLQVTSPPPRMEEVFITSDEVPAICGWWFNPDVDTSTAVFLLFHGNGENLESMKLSGTLKEFQTLHHPYLAVDYPGYGKSKGSSNEKDVIKSGLAAYVWLREQYPGHPVVICGWSLGAAVGIQVGANAP
ncbi:MAG: alpha/beta fold hydrolase, partial [Calditrichaeota bacterium]